MPICLAEKAIALALFPLVYLQFYLMVLMLTDRNKAGARGLTPEILHFATGKGWTKLAFGSGSRHGLTRHIIPQLCGTTAYSLIAADGVSYVVLSLWVLPVVQP